ncbi:methyltransferase [Xanthomonas citri]|uniref:methyltransferase n=1 Tax=Xanthomonas citri TaxID=346 RepID=UPI0018850AF4|nr:methyltransferase [Xanthomonas citri]MBE2321151.1 methyltransferase [Solirubrobacter deserti]QOY21913.1 methyltransferase [Xanthomonas citri]QQK68055.1 methyltransferase [Xanthomonas citri]
MFSSLFKRPAPQKQPLFAPGTLQLSEKMHWLARKGLIDPLALVQRHVRGDWGETDEATRQANDVAIRGDDPMISHFRITPELVLIVKTSEDHQTTVIQLPEERDMI